MRSLLQFSSAAQLCLTLCDPLDCSMLGLPVHHQPLEFTQTHVHWVTDAIQPSHPLSSPLLPPSIFPRIFFKWVSSLCQVTKVLEFQLQHQSFQWILSPTLYTSPMQQVIYFLSLWICLFWTFYIWNRTICGLLWWASYTYYSVFKVHPFCSMCL